MLLINLFVIPIALAGLLLGVSAGDPDSFVLTLPLSAGLEGLPLLVFIGGLSAATGMVIVETIALSTMVSNQLVMPLLLRSQRLHLSTKGELAGWLLGIRRIAIVLILLLGYLYHALIGDSYSLVTIGLVSFAGRPSSPRAIDRPVLAWRYSSRRHRWLNRRVLDLVLYPADTRVCPVRLARCLAAHRGAMGYRMADALWFVRPGELGYLYPFAVMEHAGQRGAIGGCLAVYPPYPP
ncbi:hypothetical protein HORIV_30420 [Vreelandella olivaria]|uniref:Uncharacterized protein n=1 Tax=Vreelandella olivaria TaxID=390919 RepID=A0ABN5WUQ1_9GAMM|nr:hypothetical protein HORIV_30420 [Halomonas olivaria]